MRHWRIIIASVFLAGFGPFVCDQSDVEEARRQLKSAEAEGALETLAGVDADAAEVHLARGLAHIALKQWEEARASLDQAWRKVAELDAIAAAERQVDEAPPLPPAQRPTADLRARIAFAKGLVALGEERWPDAIVEFDRVLALRPDDADARWNMELAWHRANPPCVQRDDDHEQDDTRETGATLEAAELTERKLCPADEDWYGVPGQRDMILFVSIEGELKPFEDDEWREVTLKLYAPGEDRPVREAPMVEGKATVGLTGLDVDGVYHVQVAGPGTAEVDYSLKVEIVPPCPADDQIEENDTPDTAHALADGDQGGLKACPGDPDWYRITVPAGEDRQLQVAFDPNRAPLVAERFSPDGLVVEETARAGKGGLALTFKADEEAETQALVRVAPVGERENTYALKLGPPNNDGGEQDQDQQDQDQDQQDEEQDQQDQDQQDQKQDQDQQDQQDQKDQQDPAQQMDIQRLIEALDQHQRNPQLEKALRELRVVPQMEDY